MSWVAVAIGGSALLGYLGSQNAAGAQTNAANQANATQQGLYNQTRQDQLPWMNRGNAAGNQMAYLLGLPGYGPGGSSWGATGGPGQPEGRVNRPQGGSWQPGARVQTGDGIWSDGPDTWVPGGDYIPQENQMGPMGGQNGQFNGQMGGYGSLSTPFSQTNWQADPGYAFRLAEGQKALERSGSARGMTLSGAQQKALMGYGQGMASQEYGNAYNRYTTDQTNLYNRLAGVAGTGQTAANQIGTFGVNAANQISSNQLGVGNANAAAWTAGTGALSNGLNSWGNWSAWNNLNGGSGAGGGTGPTNGTTFGEW